MAIVIENEGTGMIFDNSESKERNDNAPDFTGQIKVGGEQYRIALWWRDFKSGEGFSVSLQTNDGNYGGHDDEDEDDEPRGKKKSFGKKTSTSSSKKGNFKKPTRR